MACVYSFCVYSICICTEVENIDFREFWNEKRNSKLKWNKLGLYYFKEYYSQILSEMYVHEPVKLRVRSKMSKLS